MLIDLKHLSQRIVAPRLRRNCARIVIAGILLSLSGPAFAETIPWRPDVRFSRTSVDDDVRSILRSLLRANGLSAIFRPGVEGPISLRFDKVPPRQAFEQLMTERGLAYEYNPGTRTVTVYKDAAVNFDPPERVFIALTHTRYSALKDMLVRFGLGLEGVAFDSATNTVSLKGRSDRVKEITPSIVPAVAIGEGNLIRLNLNAINSAPGADVFGQIDVRSQEVQTEVLVPNGGTYIIGGLFDDTRREQESGVPGLKDIPVVGRLFKENTANSALSETIFFITPRIVEGAGPFGSDIATRLGTPEYVASRRRTLDRASESLLGTPDAEVRPTNSPYRILSELEEDES